MKAIAILREKQLPSHRCEGQNEHGRSASRFHRCHSRDTERVRIGSLYFWLCARHAWALLGAIERARSSELEQSASAFEVRP